jgi:hypothetical protein
VALGEDIYNAVGDHVYLRAVPGETLSGRFAEVEFEAGAALQPDDADTRERALVVLSVSLD